MANSNIKTPNVCKRILLAGAEGCRVVYCEDCKIAELELGAVSLRLEMSAVYNLQSVLELAVRKLSVLKAVTNNNNLVFSQSDLH